MSKTVLYEVEIKRSKDGDFLTGHYHWQVTVTIDGERDYEHRSGGWAHKVKTCKRRALKSIYKTDKQIVNGTIGVVFTAKGTISQVEDALNG